MNANLSHSAGQAGPQPAVPGGTPALHVRFLCPECRGKVRVGIGLAGQRVVCVRCSRPIQAPMLPAWWPRLPASSPASGPRADGVPSAAVRGSAEGAYPNDVLSIDLRFACPACGQRLAVDVLAAGRTVRCTRCAATVRVPALDAPPSPSLPPAPRPGTGSAVLTDEEIAFLTEPV